MNTFYLTEDVILNPTKKQNDTMDTPYKEFAIIRYKDGVISNVNDQIVEEVKTQIKSEVSENFMLTSSPWDIAELAVGCAYNRGLIDKYKYRINHENSKNISITKEKIIEYARTLEQKSELFLKTGGVHNCYICNENDMEIMISDVGRHNVLDRVCGYAIQNNINLSEKILTFSGRIPYEIINKIIKMGIKIFISVAAPTSGAITLASENDITLVGFVRGEKFNVYSGANRVIL